MQELIADGFTRDLKVEESIQNLLEALKNHKSKLTDVKPSQGERQKSYEDFIRDFSQVRGGNLFYPYVGSGIGNGVFVELLDGSVKYDFIIGIGVHLLGHSHSKVVEACLRASLEDSVMFGHLQQNAATARFSKKLLNAANAKGAKFAHCFLSSTGVMADENAFKVAFQKKFPRDRVLAFEKCFMGRTLALSQVTDKPAFRDGLPVNVKVDYVPYFDPSKPAESTDKALYTLKKHLSRYPNQHALMAFELIQGEGGFNQGTREFFVMLMEKLKKNDVAVLVDEVQTFGRTTELFAFQLFGLDALVDLVAVGKASQVCATLFTEEFKPRPGLLSQTFISSASAVAAGEVVLDELLKGNYYGAHGKNQRIFDYISKKLSEVESRHPGLCVGPYGTGGMVAFTPFGGDQAKVTKFIHALFNNGVMGFVAGSNPTRARFLLPVGAVENRHIDAAIQIVEDTLLEVARENS